MDFISPDWYILVIGLFAQLLFSARLIIQWIQSERAERSVSPLIFWRLSLFASFLLMVYGVLKNDLPIILGQGLTYFVYIRNLQMKQAWTIMPYLVRFFVITAPLFGAILIVLTGGVDSVYNIINNQDIPLGLVLWGSAGQIIFTIRFVYQWYISESEGKSSLPLGFWIISLVGSAMILSYAIRRGDLVLFLGQISGTVVYARNIMLSMNSKGIFHYLGRK